MTKKYDIEAAAIELGIKLPPGILATYTALEKQEKTNRIVKFIKTATAPQLIDFAKMCHESKSEDLIEIGLIAEMIVKEIEKKTENQKEGA